MGWGDEGIGVALALLVVGGELGVSVFSFVETRRGVPFGKGVRRLMVAVV